MTILRPVCTEDNDAEVVSLEPLLRRRPLGPGRQAPRPRRAARHGSRRCVPGAADTSSIPKILLSGLAMTAVRSTSEEWVGKAAGRREAPTGICPACDRGPTLHCSWAHQIEKPPAAEAQLRECQERLQAANRRSIDSISALSPRSRAGSSARLPFRLKCISSPCQVRPESAVVKSGLRVHPSLSPFPMSESRVGRPFRS